MTRLFLERDDDVVGEDIGGLVSYLLYLGDLIRQKLIVAFDDYAQRFPGDDGYAVTSPGISSDEAWQKLYAFLDRRYGMDTVYRYNGFLNYTGTSGDEYVFWFRSYTGAHIYYYVDMYSGDVWASVENISAGRYEERRYSFNMFDQ